MDPIGDRQPSPERCTGERGSKGGAGLVGRLAGVRLAGANVLSRSPARSPPESRWSGARFQEEHQRRVRDLKVACSRIANKTARILAYTYAGAFGRWFEARTTRTLRIHRLEAYCFGGPAAREKSGYAEDSTFKSRTHQRQVSQGRRPDRQVLNVHLLSAILSVSVARPACIAAWRTGFDSRIWRSCSGCPPR